VNTADRQTRKRLATRQKISDTATRLFIQHGFDQVTVDQIAEKSDVSRMTVFNHFARKEDMFFDLDEEVRRDMLAALRDRETGTSPVRALQRFVEQAVVEQRHYGSVFSARSIPFVETVEASETLKARVRAIRDELTALLTDALAQATRRPASDPSAALAASLMLAVWTVAILEAHKGYRKHTSEAQAMRTLRKLLDQGTRGMEAALQGTPYV
jgi:AcrR family transcriptional regulator